MSDMIDGYSENDIAIVGMACRVPGAKTKEEFWDNLVEGREATTFFTEEELLAHGVSARTLKDPNYVRAGMVLPNLEAFDSEFFGLSPKESAIMDPQHRHFLECCWEALEDSGHVPRRFDGSIGVFAGCGMGAYFMYNVITNPDLISSVGMFLLRHTGNDKDFLATRVSYALNLTGPSVNVQTACSTSLVAAHMACQSLLSFECDAALAGGVTIEIPHYRGYHFKEGEILTPDGHCRAFDHRSKGTIFGSGTGAVVLRRLTDAMEDGDRVYAVIRGSALNNDGAAKVGYLAPSVDGQAQAMTEAIAIADVTADTIDYVECHGTGTAVGDPIEVAALTRAFRETTENRGYCGIGSVKTNIGHLDTAAGVASLIKATLALYHGKVPPTINYEKPNPNIDFESSPFYVVDKLQDWPQTSSPKRASVNSLGVGGTNAHMILQEAPPAATASPTNRDAYLIPLSARNRSAIDDYGKNLADYLEAQDPDLGHVGATLFRGRDHFEHRRVMAVDGREEAIGLLRDGDTRRVFSHKAATGETSVVLMFPGGGVQYPDMARGLYEKEPVFRQFVDAGINQLHATEDVDFNRLLFPSEDEKEAVAKELNRPALQLPLIFIVEYALARLWMSKGVEPSALIGHSMGENTAACLAGVFSYSDGVGLVNLRGKLFETLPLGGMISVQAARGVVEDILPDNLDLAVVNSVEVCVVSGHAEDVEAFGSVLAEKEIEYRRIHIDVAAHSRMLEPILTRFGEYLSSIRLHEPAMPFISNRTGTWITAEQATSPQYWVDHLRHTVFFADGIGTILQKSNQILLEVGPGMVLTSLARQHPDAKKALGMIPSLRHPDATVRDDLFFLTAMGRLWACGADIPEAALGLPEKHNHLSLPSYAFRHKNYWIEPGKGATVEESEEDALPSREELENWYYRVVWKESVAEPTNEQGQLWLVFADAVGISRRITERLQQAGHKVVVVHEGDAYHRLSETEYLLSPEAGQADYTSMVRDLAAGGHLPDRIAHFWMLTVDESFRPGSSFFHRNQERGFYSLFFLAKAVAEEDPTAVLHITAMVNGMQQVADEALPYPEKATLLGPAKVIPREFPGSTCKTVDLVLPKGKKSWFGPTTLAPEALDQVAEQVYPEVLEAPDNHHVALRSGKRYLQTWQNQRIESTENPSALRDLGCYLITGGLGGVGLVMAQHLAQQHHAKLILVTRPPFPEREAWDEWLASHGSNNRTSARIRAVQDLEEMGAEVVVAAADVTDRVAMAAVIEKAEQQFGEVNGVLHAAGVLRDSPIVVKTQTEVEQVFSPKVHGTLVLDEIFKDRGLDFFVLFSSSSTALAPPGQADYVAANEFLNAYAHARPNLGAIAVNWGTWNQVGMTADLLGESAKDAGAEVAATHPLFANRTTDTRGHTTLINNLNTDNFWVLGEHRTAGGAALIPGTGYLELARAALAEQGETRTFEISDLYFLRPLHVANGSQKQMRVRLRPEQDGYAFTVQSLYESSVGDDGWETHAEARLIPCGPPAQAKLNIEEIITRCPNEQKASPGGALHTKQFDHLQLGARWQCIRNMRFGDNEAMAEIALDGSFVNDVNDYYLHPALLDMATGYPMDLIEGYERSQELWVPVSYGSVRMYGRLPARVYSWARNHGHNTVTGEVATFDIAITDGAGNLLMEVESFSVRKMAGDPDFDSFPTPSAHDLEYDATSGSDGNLSPAEIVLRHNVEMGIGAEEGAAVLERVLCGGHTARVLVSPLDLNALMKQTDKLSQQQETAGNKFARPDLDSEYTPPEDDIERKLVSFWEDLLGVDAIGVEDSFFELGGHSLIAVRLFAGIKKTFQVDFPISVLFEAPTIRAVANLIRENRPDEGDAPSGDEKTTAFRKRHTHLVAMHGGSPGSKTPFFLVAGMFGNVLNLRHLAHLIGSDRPFYGLQARGLYGGDEPHRDFQSMAADYLAEMRTVQPEGPYMLGGFSGGGITAYEMAQQLLADGEEVSLLVMLDTPLPIRPSLSKPDKLKIHMQNLKEQGMGYLGQWAEDRARWEMGKLRRKFGNLPPEEEVLSQADFHSATIEAAFREALLKYDLKSYPGRLALFRPALDEKYHLGPGRIVSSELEFVYHDNGWTPHVSNLDIFEVPGDHDSMVLEPNVRNLASRLHDCIAEAEHATALA